MLQIICVVDFPCTFSAFTTSIPYENDLVWFKHNFVNIPLRVVERVTLLRFLFGMHPCEPTLDFALFQNKQLLTTSDVTLRQRASK